MENCQNFSLYLEKLPFGVQNYSNSSTHFWGKERGGKEREERREREISCWRTAATRPYLQLDNHRFFFFSHVAINHECIYFQSLVFLLCVSFRDGTDAFIWRNQSLEIIGSLFAYPLGDLPQMKLDEEKNHETLACGYFFIFFHCKMFRDLQLTSTYFGIVDWS